MAISKCFELFLAAVLVSIIPEHEALGLEGPNCDLTTRVQCDFPSSMTSASRCISAEEVKNATNIQLPDEEGHYYCETKPNINQPDKIAWAICDKGCFNLDDAPMEFVDANAVMSLMCKSRPMGCHFPFKFNGETYHECTNAPMAPEFKPEYEDSDEAPVEAKADFRWCATQVDPDGTMVEGMWGMCDYDSCEEKAASGLGGNGNNDASEPANEAIYAEVHISPSESNKISATIKFEQMSPEAPLRIQGTVTNLPPGKHGFHVHEKADLSNQCMGAGGHFNPTNSVHGSLYSEERQAGDFGNIEADSEGTAEIDISLKIGSSSTLYGETTLIGRSLVIHEGEDDLGLGGDAGSAASGNAGVRLACGLIQPAEDASQSGLARIIIIVLIVIIVLLLILITALVIYCCKKKRQVSHEKGEEGVPFQNGDTKKKPLAYDELSIPFIDASPSGTPKVGRSSERLSFFNRTPSIGRSRGSLSDPEANKA